MHTTNGTKKSSGNTTLKTSTMKKTTTKKSSSTPTPSPTQPQTAGPANPSPTQPAANPQPATITTIATAADTANKLSQQAAYSAVVAGLLANYQPGDMFLVENVTYTRDEAVAELNRFITAAEETKTNNQAWLASVQNERQVLAEVAPVKAGIMAIVVARYGKTSPQLRQFGTAPRKPSKMTVSKKSAALTKSKATRTARGTMSKKQRQAITAAPEAPTVTASPAPTVAPAASTEATPVATATPAAAAPAPAAK